MDIPIAGFGPAPDGRGGFKPNPFYEAFMKWILGRQAPGAILNGRRVRKVNCEPNDRTTEGTLGTIMGSVGPEIITVNNVTVTYGYMVNWDNDEAEGVFTTDNKVREID